MSFQYQLTNTKLGFNVSLEDILKNRGIENVKEFLNPSEANVENENLFDNIDSATEILFTHIKNDHKISILVDCDADGYTSAAMMYQYTKDLIRFYKSNSKLNFVIHNDKKHGLDNSTIKKLRDSGWCNLLIIPDASSNDYKQHKWLRKIGIDIIILDHHECDYYSKNAIVINNQLSSKITNKSMTGVGVVYKLCKYIDKKLNLNYSDDYLDLVTIGMIGDVCDLRNLESRFLVQKGIKQIENETNKNKLITSMIDKKSYDMKNKITILGIAFYIVPLINSIIRNGTYEEKELMFKGFVNSDEVLIDKIRGKGEVELSIQDYVVRIAEKCKRKQKKLIDDGVEVLVNQIENFNLNKNAIIVVNGTNLIDNNYTGLIANKLTSLYQKPCLLLRTQKDKLAGSGRGFEKKKIKDFKEWCNETKLFDYAEGHGNAFGVQIDSSKINKLYELIATIEDSNELIYYVDGLFNEKNLNKYIIESISKHDDIWGTSVNEPIFAIDGVTVNTKDIALIGSKKTTLKFKHKDVEFIKFKSSEEEFNDIVKYKAIQITLIGRFGVNTYNGIRTPQITIEDMKYKEGTVKFRF